MIKKISSIILIAFLMACNEGNVANIQEVVNPQDPLNPGNPGSLTPTTTATATATPIPGGDPASEPHQFGVPRTTANASTGKLIPITFIFINSSTQTLTNNPVAEANKAIGIMNQRFTRQGISYVKFSLKQATAVVDDLYFNTSCNNLGAVSSKYGSVGTMTMVVVNDLAGSCAGVAYVWKFPKDKTAVTMSEFNHPFVEGKWTPVVHEFAHSFGLQHTGDEYAGSVPTTGLKFFNSLLPGGGSGRSCGSSLKYFIDPVKRHNGAVADGVTFDSYYNTMYPSYGGQPDNGFFTAGYDYSMSWAFDCWYQFAKTDV